MLKEPDKLLGGVGQGLSLREDQGDAVLQPAACGRLQNRLAIVDWRAKEETGGALASFSAAEILAPHVRQHRLFAYWRGRRENLVEALELKPVDSGENVVILEPYDEGVLYPWGRGAIPVTGPVQTYLDVHASPARGEEAAGAVFDRCLKDAYLK